MNLRETVESKILYILLTYTKELIQTPDSESGFDIIRKHSLTWELFADMKHQFIFKSIQNQIAKGLQDVDFLNIVQYRPAEYKVFPQQANDFYAMVVSLTNMNYAPFSELEKLIYKLKEFNLQNWWLVYGQKILSSNFEVSSIVDFGNLFVDEYTAYQNKLLGGVVSSYSETDETQELMKKYNARLSGLSFDVPNPSAKLRNKLGGNWAGPDLIIIGARPGMGKTSVTIGLIIPPSYTHDILLWSLEVTKTQIMNKLASHHTGIPYNAIKHGKLTAYELQCVQDAFQYIKTWMKIHIVDAKMPTLEQFKVHARKLHAQGKLKMIVIDYLQLIKTTEKKAQREQEVSHISRELKLLANELNVPVIALAQLKRPQEGNIISKPKLTDLRESGSIEQDADIVIFLHRDFYYQDKSLDIPYETQFITECIIEKSRDGVLSTVKIFNDVKKLRLTDI